MTAAPFEPGAQSVLASSMSGGAPPFSCFANSARISPHAFSRRFLEPQRSFAGVVSQCAISKRKASCAARPEAFLRAQLLHRATLLAARFRLGPCRRSACFLYGADDVHGLVRRDQAVNSGDALACAFLPARFWFSDVSPFA
jgi:hypothetical protein